MYLQTCSNTVGNAVIDLEHKLGTDGAGFVAHYSDVRFANESLSRILLVNRLIRFTKKRTVRDYGIVWGSLGLISNDSLVTTLSDSIILNDSLIRELNFQI